MKIRNFCVSLVLLMVSSFTLHSINLADPSVMQKALELSEVKIGDYARVLVVDDHTGNIERTLKASANHLHIDYVNTALANLETDLADGVYTIIVFNNWNRIKPQELSDALDHLLRKLAAHGYLIWTESFHERSTRKRIYFFLPPSICCTAKWIKAQTFANWLRKPEGKNLSYLWKERGYINVYRLGDKLWRDIGVKDKTVCEM